MGEIRIVDGNMERLTEKLKSGEYVPKAPLYTMCDKLGEYEDLEEQNRLLKLPCAVGDMVYTINPLPGEKTVIGETPADAFFCALSMLEGRFGKTIFLTQEEAEAALKEMENRCSALGENGQP